MRKVYILIGVAGSGKSTFSESLKETSVILSSDNIREELFGDLTHQSPEDHKKVFELLHSRLKDELKNGSKDIIYDATNLNRKKRVHLYKEIKAASKGAAHVESVAFIKPLNYLYNIEENRSTAKQVGKENILRMYKSFTPPKEGVDCDSFYSYYGNNLEEFAEEFSGDTPHDTPFHLESVREHIQMTIDNAKKTGNPLLVKVAQFHDLGKFVTKQKTDRGASFYGHENVSSMYYMASIDGYPSEEQKLILGTIYSHMTAHQGITEKFINRNNLSKQEVDLINRFGEIDSISRIPDPNLEQIIAQRKSEREAAKESVTDSSKGISQNIQDQTGSIRILGNIKSKIFHVPGQAHYDRLRPENAVIFSNEAQATSAGFRKSSR